MHDDHLRKRQSSIFLTICRELHKQDSRKRNLPILKLVVANVGHVNNRGKIMYNGMTIPRQMSPSAI